MASEFALQRAVEEVMGEPVSKDDIAKAIRMHTTLRLRAHGILQTADPKMAAQEDGVLITAMLSTAEGKRLQGVVNGLRALTHQIHDPSLKGVIARDGAKNVEDAVDTLTKIVIERMRVHFPSLTGDSLDRAVQDYIYGASQN